MVDPHKLAQASLFFKLFCRASDLQTDLAKRIMYSVIPHVATPAEMHHTQGIIDQRALKAAAEGRHRIIDYGIEAISEELGHAFNEERDDANPAYQQRFDSLIENKSFRMALTFAGKIFDNPKIWASQYGGAPWKAIAECLWKLISLDIQLAKIRYDKQEHYRPELLDAELETLRQIVTQMNVFDGLTHNTDNIMSKLVEIENHRKSTKYDEAAQKAFNQLQDAKELSSPVDVFKTIAPTLEGSGDINRYKDWVSKLTKLPEYNRSQQEITNELSRIRLRKKFLLYRQRLPKNLEELKTVKKLYSINEKEITNPRYRDKVGRYLSDIGAVTAELNTEFIELSLDHNFLLQLESAHKLGQTIRRLMEIINNKLWNLNPNSNLELERNEIVSGLEKVIKESQTLLFFLDAV